MKFLNERFYQMSNVIFCYELNPVQLAVYSYLVCCAGNREKCYPSMKTIAACCGCSINTARKAVDVLDKQKFIRKVECYRTDNKGRNRQANNVYFILDLPQLPIRNTTSQAKYHEKTEN